MRLIHICALIFLASYLCSDDLQNVELKDINFGTHVCGPKLGQGDLVGRVVIFDYWGVELATLNKSIPHLSSLAALADADQLIVIASQVQAVGETGALWKKYGGSEQITVVDSGRITSAQVSTIPKTIVFDHNGKMVFNGSPNQIDAQYIKKLLNDGPGPMLKYGDTYTACAAEANALKNIDAPITAVLKSLRQKSEKGKDDVKAEALQLLDRIKAYLDSKLEKIKVTRTQKPLEANKLLLHMTMLVKGDELAKPFEEMVKELKGDKAYMNELNAASALAMIKAEATKIGLDRGDVNVSTNSKAKNLILALDQLCKKYPGMQAAKEAEELMKKWMPN